MFPTLHLINMKYLLLILLASCVTPKPKGHKHLFTISDGCSCKCIHGCGNFCSVAGCKAKEIRLYDNTGKIVSMIVYPGDPKYARPDE